MIGGVVVVVGKNTLAFIILSSRARRMSANNHSGGAHRRDRLRHAPRAEYATRLEVEALRAEVRQSHEYTRETHVFIEDNIREIKKQWDMLIVAWNKIAPFVNTAIQDDLAKHLLVPPSADFEHDKATREGDD